MMKERQKAGKKNITQKDSYMIRVKGVNKKFDNYDEIQSQINVLENISFDVNGNEILSILGPSGCGKTTLLKIMAGLLKADQGKIDGENISKGMVFQDDALMPWFNVEHNVEIGLIIQGEDKEVRKRKTREMIQTVGLEGFEKFYPYQLSGGMKKRVSIARSLVMDSKLILMDEPFGALDLVTKYGLLKDLRNMQQKNGFSVCMVTHDIEEAVYISDRILILSRNKNESSKILKVIRVPQTEDWSRDNDEFIAIRDILIEIIGQKGGDSDD